MANPGPRYSSPTASTSTPPAGQMDKVTLTALPLVARMRRAGRQSVRAWPGITGARSTSSESIPGWTAGPQRGALPGPGWSGSARRRRAGELGPGGQGHLRPPRHHRHGSTRWPLIGSRSSRKKAATGSGHLLCDVKAGSGASHEDPGGGLENRRGCSSGSAPRWVSEPPPGDRHGRRPGFGDRQQRPRSSSPD